MDSAKDKVSNARDIVVPVAVKAKTAANSSWDTAIGVFVPLADAARDGAARAAKLPHKEVTNRWYSRNDEPKAARLKAADTPSGGHLSGTLIGLLAAGAAIGATGALVARRRNRTRWADYEPGSVKSDAAQLIDTTKQKLDTDTDYPDVAHKVATWAKDHVDQLRHKIHEATADHPDSLAAKAKSGAHDVKEKISEGAAHLHEKSEARLNDASARRGTANKAADGTTDEVEDLLRSTRNGRM